MSLNYANQYFRRSSKTTSKTNYRFVVADDPSACFKTTPTMWVFTAFHTPDTERYLQIISDFDTKSDKTANTLHETPSSFTISRLGSNRSSVYLVFIIATVFPVRCELRLKKEFSIEHDRYERRVSTF